jgi:hypothetical protein
MQPPRCCSPGGSASRPPWRSGASGALASRRRPAAGQSAGSGSLPSEGTVIWSADHLLVHAPFQASSHPGAPARARARRGRAAFARTKHRRCAAAPCRAIQRQQKAGRASRARWPALEAPAARCSGRSRSPEPHADKAGRARCPEETARFQRTAAARRHGVARHQARQDGVHPLPPGARRAAASGAPRAPLAPIERHQRRGAKPAAATG